MATKGHKNWRNLKGQLPSLLLGLLVFAAFAVFAVALDIANVTLVREEMMSACDSGALAGAAMLTRDPLKDNETLKACLEAERVTGLSKAGNLAVKDDKSVDGKVVATVDITNPNLRFCKVTATRSVPNLFAKIFGQGANQLEVTSIAVAQKGILTLPAGRGAILLPSLDVAPSRGRMEGLALNSYVDGKQEEIFTLVFSPRDERNTQILDQSGNSIYTKDQLSIGQTVTTRSGADEGQLVSLEPGEEIVVPLVEGGTQSDLKATIVAFAGLRIVALRLPDEIDVRIVTPKIVQGTPGLQLPRDKANWQFAQQNSPWRVMLWR